ncbi:MAG: TlyA family RNA methyltransferase, partial [Oscillospiraceae bacterium]
RNLLTEDGEIVCLIKPQFEAGRDKVGKKGVVREKSTHIEVVQAFLDFAPGAGLTPLGLGYSPIRGPEGNIEYLAILRKGQYEAPELSAEAVVEASHSELEK